MRGVALAVALVGCYSSTGVPCGDLLCPAERVCSASFQCVLPAQVTACAGRADAEACSYPGVSDGVCYDSLCVVAGCGNSIVEPGEVCDDGNRISFDGCRFDCQSSELCGDGSIDLALGELCDCGTAEPAPTGCTGPNSETPGATCRPDCRLARCGDGIVDQSELCDDGNLVAGDGCRADCQGRYTKLQTPTANNLRDVFVLGERAWAVGEQGTVLAFDGTTWSVDQFDASILQAVWATGPNNVFVGGSQGIRRWNGTVWESWLVGSAQIAGIWGSSATNVYAVGSGGNRVFRYTGGASWAPITTPCFPDAATAVWGASATNIVVVGEDNGVCWWNGSIWQLVSPTGARAVTGTITPFSVFATDDSQLYRSPDATTWSAIPTAGRVLALASVSADRLLGVGPSGVVLELDVTSQTWTHLLAPTELDLNAVSSSGPTNIYIVGQAGTVLH